MKTTHEENATHITTAHDAAVTEARAHVVARLADEAKQAADVQAAHAKAAAEREAAQTDEEKKLRAELSEIDQYCMARRDPEVMERGGQIAKRLRVLERLREARILDAREAVRKAAETPHVMLPSRFDAVAGLRLVVRTARHDNPFFAQLSVDGVMVHLPPVGFLTNDTAGAFEAALEAKRAAIAHVSMAELPSAQRLLAVVIDDPAMMWDGRTVLGLAGVAVADPTHWLTTLQDPKLLVRWGMTAEAGIDGAARFLARDVRPGGAAPLAEKMFAAASYVAASKPGACSIDAAISFWRKHFENGIEPDEPIVTTEPTTRRRRTAKN